MVMKQKVITALTELSSSGIIKIDRKLLPKGFKIKQILSSCLESNLNLRDIFKKDRFIVTLLLEGDENMDVDKETEDNEPIFLSLNPYI
jgi:hypothetical protein